MSWKPLCFEEKCLEEHKKIFINHDKYDWLKCKECGQLYTECICQYFEEPCLSCEYKKKNPHACTCPKCLGIENFYKE